MNNLYDSKTSFTLLSSSHTILICIKPEFWEKEQQERLMGQVPFYYRSPQFSHSLSPYPLVNFVFVMRLPT